jgi:hypothetical protein
MPALHQKENRTKNRGVLAQVKSVWGFLKMRMHHPENAKFPCHVVGLWGDRAQRTAP